MMLIISFWIFGDKSVVILATGEIRSFFICISSFNIANKFSLLLSLEVAFAMLSLGDAFFSS